jgi:hypothetical protein
MDAPLDALERHRSEYKKHVAWENRYLPIVAAMLYVFTFGGLLFMGTKGILW